MKPYRGNCCPLADTSAIQQALVWQCARGRGTVWHWFFYVDWWVLCLKKREATEQKLTSRSQLHWKLFSCFVSLLVLPCDLTRTVPFQDFALGTEQNNKTLHISFQPLQQHRCCALFNRDLLFVLISNWGGKTTEQQKLSVLSVSKQGFNSTRMPPRLICLFLLRLC